MVSTKITISSIKELKSGTTLWDIDVKGFGCRCRQDASTKVFIVKYRFGKGRSARQYLFTIGKLGSPWTPETARDEAKRVLGRVANGENPAEERKDHKIANSVDEAFTLFIAGSHDKRAPRTIAEYQRLYNKWTRAYIGPYKIQDVTRADVARLHTAMSKTPPQANRLLQMLSALFTWCEKCGYRAEGTNPCRYVEKYKEFSKERFLSLREMQALNTAVQKYEHQYGHIKENAHKKNKSGDTKVNIITPFVVSAVKLLIYTGARRNEILELKWDDVDFRNRLIRLQRSKTGQRTIYLSAPAMQTLAEILRIEGNPYVICGAKDRERLANIKDPWGRIRKMATIDVWMEDDKIRPLIEEATASLPPDTRPDQIFTAAQELAKVRSVILPPGLSDVRLHDLRHTYASFAVTGGHHLKIVGSLLSHTSIKTTERYAHLSNDPIQAANEAIADSITQAMNGPQYQDNVTNLRERIH